jgi:hypothetical protein
LKINMQFLSSSPWRQNEQSDDSNNGRAEGGLIIDRFAFEEEDKGVAGEMGQHPVGD